MSAAPTHAGEFVRQLVIELRGHAPLVDLLPERYAIYQGHPSDEAEHPIAVTLTPISEGSTPHRGMMQREFRVQVTVKSRRAWREELDAPGTGTTGLTRMYAILGHVGDRLDRMHGIAGSHAPLGAEGGPAPQDMGDGRLGVVGDWRIRTFG